MVIFKYLFIEIKKYQITILKMSEFITNTQTLKPIFFSNAWLPHIT